MIKAFCDKCENEINIPNPIHVAIYREVDSDDPIDFILCESCANDLLSYLKEE